MMLVKKKGSGPLEGYKHVLPLWKTVNRERTMISLGLKEKLMENQNSLKGSQVSDNSLSGEGSDFLRLFQFTSCFSLGPILKALIYDGVYSCHLLGLHLTCPFS